MNQNMNQMQGPSRQLSMPNIWMKIKLADKAEYIEQYLKQKNLSWNDVWYIGNDVNDLGAIGKAKLSICPADAVKKVRKAVDLILETNGGYGVLSEIVTLLEN